MMHINVDSFVMVMEVLGLVSGVIGAFVIFFGFLSEKNEKRYTGKLEKLYNFLNFRFYIIEDVLKFCYVLAASLCTGIGLFMSLTVVELTWGLVLFIGGNLAARIVFEFLMMIIKACRNLGEIGKEPFDGSVLKEEPQMGKKPELPTKIQDFPEVAAAKEELLTEERPKKHTETVEKVFIKKEKYKVCPSCGEKCSSKFAFCNMCGSKLP